MATNPRSATRLNPRISANDLAHFLVAGERGRIGIVRRSKFSDVGPMRLRYREVRPILRNALCDIVNENRILADGRSHFEQLESDPSLSAFAQDDASKSIDVLDALPRLRNQYAGTDFMQAPNQQPNLMISGVEVSIQCDVLIHAEQRNEQRVGGALFRLTQGDDDPTPAARTRRQQMGLYSATLVFMHVRQHLAGNRTVRPQLCWSMDIQDGEIYNAPARFAARVQEIESACFTIAALWDRVERT